MEESEKRTRTFKAAMEVTGPVLTKPFLTLQTIPFTGLPFLRITDSVWRTSRASGVALRQLIWRYCPQPVDHYLTHLLMMFEKIVLLSLKQPAAHHMLENAQN
jgi:hypothetical protein